MTYTLSDFVNSSWEADVTCEMAGRDCLSAGQPVIRSQRDRTSDVAQRRWSSDSLDHVRDDTVRLPWSSIVGRTTIPKHLQGGVSTNAILVTKRLLLGTVDLGELDTFLCLEISGGHFVFRCKADESAPPRVNDELTRLTSCSVHTLHKSAYSCRTERKSLQGAKNLFHQLSPSAREEKGDASLDLLDQS